MTKGIKLVKDLRPGKGSRPSRARIPSKPGQDLPKVDISVYPQATVTYPENVKRQ